MARDSDIEWCTASWNPIRGCTRVSQGCVNCYAEALASRFNQPGQWGHGFATRTPARWTGRVELVESQLDLPRRWRKPERIFVNSTADLFHEALPFEAIDRIFAVMAQCHWHRFIVLTKRADRMRAYATDKLAGLSRSSPIAEWPLPHVALGVSVEDEDTALSRIRELLATPAAVRAVSYEPALAEVHWRFFGLDWIIAGGESGAGARPAEIAWFRAARCYCERLGVPFFMKQVTTGGRKLPIEAWPADLRVREYPEALTLPRDRAASVDNVARLSLRGDDAPPAA